MFCRECKEEYHEGECSSFLSTQGAVARKVEIPTTRCILIILLCPARVTFVKLILIIILSQNSYVHDELLWPLRLTLWWISDALIDRAAELSGAHRGLPSVDKEKPFPVGFWGYLM